MLIFRPPPVDIGEEDSRHARRNDLRSDIQSDEVRRVHPFLPNNGPGKWEMHADMVHRRQTYLRQYDQLAYEGIREKYPSVRPAGASMACPLTLRTRMRIRLERAWSKVRSRMC
mgnify:CR=1 FL=1|jgi:hypothetical protein